MKKNKVGFFEGEVGNAKKVLLVGLGILGGGTSMAKFILEEGGELTVTDLRDEEILNKEIHLVKKIASKNKYNIVNFILGEHTEEIFKNTDVVVFNPAVPYFSKWPQYCLENKIPFYNDFTLFQEYVSTSLDLSLQKRGETQAKQVWITGTRGKSTTTSFVHTLLGEGAVIGGNVLGQGLQKISKNFKKTVYFVLETSNYQLEYPIFDKNIVEPKVAVITNIFVDHINRHKTLEEYRRVKKTVFNYNKDTLLFLNKAEKSVREIWEKNEHINVSFVNKSKKEFVAMKEKYKNFSSNQIISLMFAIGIARYFKVSEKEIEKRIKKIEIPKMRQEIIFENKKFKIINDSTATSPDALMACIKSFPEAYFISGGTDAELDFTDLVQELKKNKLVEKNKIKFLKGTATDKILLALKINSKTQIEQELYQDLEVCLNAILRQVDDINQSLKRKIQTTIILSPGAKSFGLFKNEYDRGEKFNKIVKKILNKGNQ